MKIKSKTLAVVFISALFFTACNKEKELDINNEEAFKSTEAFSRYLQTLDFSERKAAVAKFVSLL